MLEVLTHGVGKLHAVIKNKFLTLIVPFIFLSLLCIIMQYFGNPVAVQCRQNRSRTPPTTEVLL